MKNIVITGAAGNLGKVVVESFLGKGYRVIAVAKDAAEAASLRDDPAHGREASPSQKAGGEGTSLQAEIVDLTDESAVQAFAAGTIRKYGTVDAVLMLAGGFAMGG